MNLLVRQKKLKNKNSFNDYVVINNFELFNNLSDVILANRLDDVIGKYKDKVYTRDLFTRDQYKGIINNYIFFYSPFWRNNSQIERIN